MKKSTVLIKNHRRRQVPRHYSWLDHRLVRENHLKNLSPDACSLYLFLVCVGDQDGLSYYSESAISSRLSLANIHSAREDLLEADLLAYESPFYQVLSLPEKKEKPKRTGDDPVVLRKYLEDLK